MDLVELFLRFKLNAVEILNDILVFDLKGFHTSPSFFKLNLFLISSVTYLSIAVVMETLFLWVLLCFFTTCFEHLLAVLEDGSLFDNFLVLIAFKFSERVSMLSLVAGSFELVMVLITLRSQRLDQLLLLKYHLLERPAALHPTLEMLLNLFVSHLPALDFFTHPTSLTLQSCNLDLHGVGLCLCDSLYEFL